MKTELILLLKTMQSSYALKKADSNQANLLKFLIKDCLEQLKDYPCSSEVNKLKFTISWIIDIFNYHHFFKQLTSENIAKAKEELDSVNAFIANTLTDKIKQILEIAVENTENYLVAYETYKKYFNEIRSHRKYHNFRYELMNYLEKLRELAVFKISNGARMKELNIISAWVLDVLNEKFEMSEKTLDLLHKEIRSKSIWDAPNLKKDLIDSLFILGILSMPFIPVIFAAHAGLIAGILASFTVASLSLAFIIALVPTKSLAHEVEYFLNLAEKQMKLDDEYQPLLSSKSSFFSKQESSLCQSELWTDEPLFDQDCLEHIAGRQIY